MEQVHLFLNALLLLSSRFKPRAKSFPFSIFLQTDRKETEDGRKVRLIHEINLLIYIKVKYQNYLTVVILPYPASTFS
jgi:hypothetical protein